jgi:transposase
VALTRSSSAPAGLAQRARIVLLAADGVSNTEIASRMGISRPTVIAWRARYDTSGIGGVARPCPIWPTARTRSRPNHLDHSETSTAQIRCDPLEFAAFDQAPGV